MTDLTDDVLTIRNLRDLLGEARTRNIELARINADLERHNRELRQAVDALLQPAASELLSANLTESERRKTSGK
jgi:hypothetical protein